MLKSNIASKRRPKQDLATMDRVQRDGEGQVKRLWSDRLHVAEKLERDLAPKDRSNGKEQVRLRSMDLMSMWWFLVYLKWLGEYLRQHFPCGHQICGIWICARQRYET